MKKNSFFSNSLCALILAALTVSSCTRKVGCYFSTTNLEIINHRDVTTTDSASEVMPQNNPDTMRCVYTCN